jgi:carboxypeptidase Q
VKTPLPVTFASFALLLTGGCGGSTPAAAPPPPAELPAPPAPSASAAPAAPVAAAPADAELAALLHAGLASTTALDVTRSLSDHVGARIVGSAGFDRAVRWATGTMNELRLSNVHTEPVTVQRWERGAESAEMVEPSPQRLEITTLGGSPATPASGLTAEVVEVSSIEALEKLPDEAVKGRIVFFDKPMQRTRDQYGYAHGADVRFQGPAAAAKKGARGVLVRSITSSPERYAHTGAMRTKFKPGSPYEHVKLVPAGAIAVPDAEMLHRLLAEHAKVKVKMLLTPRSPGVAHTFNVVGEIPGSSDPQSVVLLGAHLDSWDLGTGAQDDGAGCGIVLAAASLLLQNHVVPARTVRVVLFAGEENGDFGAIEYARAHAAEAPHIVAAVEADEGAGRVFEVRALGEHGATFSALTDALAPLHIEAKADPSKGGSDINELRPLGVPSVDLTQDVERYFDVHHTKNDVMDQIDPEQLAQVATAYALTTDVLARAGATLGRAPAPEAKKP